VRRKVCDFVDEHSRQLTLIGIISCIGVPEDHNRGMAEGLYLPMGGYNVYSIVEEASR
jgi:hypothetical protein